MVTICILVGLGLIVCGVIIARVTKKNCNKKSNGTIPPLPPRVNVETPVIVSQQQTGIYNSNSITPLPPRRTSVLAAVNAERRATINNGGPRGIKPTQFPCCPFDKQRNLPGGPQVIFWDSGSNCYHCSRGHQFKSNGKLL